MRRKHLCVLVVDDEREIRTLLTDILEGSGHEVSCASDASSAMGLVTAGGRRFDLAFVDYVLPGEDGLSLTSRLREIRPDLPVVLLTGDTAVTTTATSAPDGPTDVMTKPFGLAVVEALLERIAS